MGFFRDLEDDIKDIGRDIDDAVFQPIKENPIGAIVSIGGIALGIPPVYAGALGGAAGAASTGGDILKGAVLGGVGGYVGGAAAGAAANAGAGTVLSSAAGGAAAGAAGSALTGGSGSDILRGALTGGAMGAASGYIRSEFFSPDKATYTRTYDDGSTIEYTAAGDVVKTTPATDITAPVFEFNSNTGQIEPVNKPATPPLNELSVGDTQDLINRNVTPGLIDNIVDTGGGGGGTGGGSGEDGVEAPPFRAEVVGAAGQAEAPQFADTQFRTPNTDLANQSQIDSGQATYNRAANAWEVNSPYQTGSAAAGGTTYRFDDGSSLTFNPDGSSTSIDTAGVSKTYSAAQISAGRGAATGGITYQYDDGSWLTINPDGSSVSADYNGVVSVRAGGTVTGPATGGSAVDLGEIVITAPREPVTDLGEITITAPRPGGPAVVTPAAGTAPVTPPAVTPTTPGTIDYPTPVVPTTPIPPVFPVIVPGGGTGGGGGTPTTPRTPGGPISGINLPGGLQPGFMNPTEFYNTTNDAQSKFSYGARAFQPGPTFDANLYNSAPAPLTPYGIQQIARSLTPDEMLRASRGEAINMGPVSRATRVTAPGNQQTVPVFNQGSTVPTVSLPTPAQIGNTPGLGSTGIGVNLPPLPVAPAATPAATPPAATPPAATPPAVSNPLAGLPVVTPAPRPATPAPTPAPAPAPATTPFVAGPAAPVVVGPTPAAPIAPAPAAPALSAAGAAAAGGRITPVAPTPAPTPAPATGLTPAQIANSPGMGVGGIGLNLPPLTGPMFTGASLAPEMPTSYYTTPAPTPAPVAPALVEPGYYGDPDTSMPANPNGANIYVPRPDLGPNIGYGTMAPVFTPQQIANTPGLGAGGIGLGGFFLPPGFSLAPQMPTSYYTPPAAPVAPVVPDYSMYNYDA